jgi:hypothetical protein
MAIKLPKIKRGQGYGLISLVVLLAFLVLYYAWVFGFDEPWNENLFGNYSMQRYTTYGVRVRQNMPLSPDKFVTLTGLAGTLLLLLRRLWLRYQPAGNVLVRLLLVAGVLLLVPVSFYLLVYASIVALVAIVVFVIYWTLRLVIGYILKGAR